MGTIQADTSKPCDCCGFYPNRGLGIDAIIEKNSSILLIKRKGEPYKGYWALPGGFVDWNITAEDTVKKEVREEVNMDVISMKLLGVYSDPNRHPRQGITLLYVVEAEGQAKAGDDAQEAQWFTFDNVPLELGFDHHRLIKDYLAQKNNAESNR